MDNETIVNVRLLNQQLRDSTMKTPESVVSWMGAMQAQDYNMAKWAIGIRIPGCPNRVVEDAFNEGKILRTHLLRPTWHFVLPENIRWMLELTGPKIKSSTKSRDRDLGITEELYSKSNDVIQKTLSGNKQLTRDELAIVLRNSGIEADTSRMIHFMMRAEVEGIVCSGAMKEKKHTYMLLEERVPAAKPLNKDEALARLAQIYFNSHAPATLQDFCWWSGLSVSEARHALELVKTGFVSEVVDSQTYWINNSSERNLENRGSVHLLPAFDEYIIGYRDRRAVLSSENHSKAISSNGVFRPALLRNGKVIGIWKRAAAEGKPVIPVFFEQPDTPVQELIKKACIAFEFF